MHRAAVALLAAAACCAVAQPAGTVSPAEPIRLSSRADVVALPAHSVAWIDRKGAATIEEVASAADALDWRQRAPGQQDRLDDGALWVRFDVLVEPSARWYLEVGSAGVDRVQLFHRAASGAWTQQDAGDHVPVARWPLPGRVPTFALAEHPQPVRYWLRVQHSRVDFAASLKLVREPVLLAQREREQFLLGAYFGLAVLIAAASLANGIAYRDRAFLVYALYVTLLGAGQLARLGIGAQHLWPQWQAWNESSSFLLPGLSTAAALWFVRVVTEPARFSRALDVAASALVVGMLAAVALDGVLANRTSLNVALAGTALSMTAMAAMIGWSWIDGRDTSIRLIAFGFLPVLLFAIFPVARGLNLIPDSTLTRYGVFIGALLEMPILYYALRVRSDRRRVSELRAAALSRTDALTGLALRRILVQRLETAIARARTHKQHSAMLVVGIANMEAIESEFGRETAEKAVVVAASHLRRAITDIDLAARVEDHTFALLLEGPLDAAQAMSRAQLVVASGLRQTHQLPAALTLKFHVTVAMLPHDDGGADATLQWMLEALELMPADSKKLIRPLNF